MFVDLLHRHLYLWIKANIDYDNDAQYDTKNREKEDDIANNRNKIGSSISNQETLNDHLSLDHDPLVKFTQNILLDGILTTKQNLQNEIQQKRIYGELQLWICNSS